MGEEVEEEDEIQDPDFKKKRAGHYGGEAEAMKLAQVSRGLLKVEASLLNASHFCSQALMAQESLNDEDDD
jgi:hypothetical protein